MNLFDSIKRWKKILLNLKKYEKRFETLESNFATLLSNHYTELNNSVDYKTMLRNKEFKVFSQNGEDGLLAFIFSQIGTTNQTFIEFGIGNGTECNAANLIKNFGWNGLLIDGSKEGTDFAKIYYRNEIQNGKVKIDHQFLTVDNINQIFQKNGVTGEIDLLSIDIDGNDYWVWEAINIVNPRVVAIEYNASFGSKKSISIPYKSDFYRFSEHKSGWYHGASIVAFEKIGKKLGYSLIGCNSDGVNAFFIRNDIDKKHLQSHSSDYLYYDEKKRCKLKTTENQFNMIKHLPLIEIK